MNTLRSYSTRAFIKYPLHRPAIIRSAYFLGASTIAGGLSLALYSRGTFSALTGFLPFNKLGNTFSSSARMPAEDFPVQKSDEDWRVQLSPEQFRILRKKGTEMAGTGKYDKMTPTQGVFNCAGCDAPLYNYDHKFSSGCGWPAFHSEIPGSVVRHEDRTFGMSRTEILCANCGGHLGHVFKGEGYGYPKDERHCVNSVSIQYAPDAKVESKQIE